MTGLLAAFVGPSGVGKDSLMQAVHSACPETHLVRRVITRAPEAGGEDYEAVTPETFRQRASSDAFLVHWQAHGLSYGIPAQVSSRLDAGQTCLVNLSRSALTEVAGKVTSFRVLSISASPEVLARRLAARGRESAEDILRRLDRVDPGLPPGLDVVRISNDGTLEQAAAIALAALQPVRA